MVDNTDAPRQLLDLKLPDNDAGAPTVRAYLIELLTEVWVEEEGFNGKRPFGNSGWQNEVYSAMFRQGIVADEDYDAAEELVLAAIKLL